MAIPMLAALLCAACSTATHVVAPVPPLPPLSAVTVTPHVDTLQAGSNFQFAATALDTLGAVLAGARFTWTSDNPGVFTVDGSGTAHAVAEGTALLHAAAGGKSDTARVTVFVQRGWVTQTSNTGNDLNGVFFLGDGRTGWAVGRTGRIIATTNAGANWSMQVSNSGFDLNAVWFTTATEGWVVGSGGALLHTTNAGTTWGSVTSNAGENLLDVWFATPDTGWVVGQNGVILRTFDRGASWQRQSPTLFDLMSVSFSDTRNGWAVGNGGVILGTHDRGLSWFVYTPSVTSLALRAVWRRSTAVAWAAGSQGAVPMTSAVADSAQWTLLNAGANFELQGLCYPTDGIGYAVGYNSGGVAVVLRTDDGGVSWQSQVPNTGFRLKDAYFTDPLHGWAVGRNGSIVHTSSGGLP